MMKKLDDIVLPVLNEIRAGQKDIEVSELWGASKALFLFGLWRKTARPIIVVTATEEEAVALIDDMHFFEQHDALLMAKSDVIEEGNIGPKAVLSLFPAWGLLPFEADSPDSGTIGERMRFLHSLTLSRSGIYVISSFALLQKILPHELFKDSVRSITTATQIDPDSLTNLLISTGYESTSLVTRVGEMSRRGGIIDFFSPYHENPTRVEFSGEIIESIRLFDSETQRSLSKITEAIVLPVRELIINNKSVERMRARINDEIMIGQIQQGGIPPGGEFLAPFFYDLVSLFDYLPDDILFTLVEPDEIKKAIRNYSEKIEHGRREEEVEGRVLPEIQEIYLDLSEIETQISNFSTVRMPLLGSNAGHRMDTKSSAWLGLRLLKSRDTEHAATTPREGSMAGLVEKMKQLRKNSLVSIVCGTDEAGERFKNLLMDYGLGVVLEPVDLMPDYTPRPVTITVGKLTEGFIWHELGITVITEEEIFGRKVHRVKAKKLPMTPFLSTFKDLKPSDFVVHSDYGVGEYQGLTHINVDNFETDFLILRYEPDAKLYVPLYSLDKVQKYIGAEGIAPRLDRLGTPTWSKTKEKIKKDILEMAQQLVGLYAARAAMERTSFSPPDNLYREFESAFPYEETPDQLKAIEDVLVDLQRPRPMDRLVCGDVGYGKTEVALRAAFKVVEDGLQVAVLVPTTLLADQHYRTFSERLTSFSIRVDLLSRFRTRTEQSATLKDIKNGNVDIVIGTHRLLQKDIAFKKLGLLVIDEEHKFGVRHKERIKEFKKLVDVLTLTATPIPRTLHMSLAGLRDLSIIHTPPLDRQSIQVVLARFGKRVIREAITREIQRGGQVFFVHNRVQGIDRIADFVQNLVPEAKVGIAHGQMKEGEIEDVMAQFINKSLNVLITTAIIESGIDIPTANTIIINRAERFGLADLYQIKGRVGRSREKAYAYLLTPEDELLSETARKRLRAIQELSELGAGFRIAAQDLETRGAGNLLGKQQSGHIAAIGIDLYTQMMEDAIAELQGEEIEPRTDTIINLQTSAFIPENYIEDVSLRLAAYKEISSIEDDAEISLTKDALRDRYGILPESVENLFEIMSIKCIARRAMVARIDAGKGFANITFAENAHVSPDKVMMLLKKSKGRCKLIAEYTLQIAFPDTSLKTACRSVKKSLQELL